MGSSPTARTRHALRTGIARRRSSRLALARPALIAAVRSRGGVDPLWDPVVDVLEAIEPLTLELQTSRRE
ncbi:MAG TPA: hypothetical protein VGK83_07815 [Acidimicrobiia bacterium]